MASVRDLRPLLSELKLEEEGDNIVNDELKLVEKGGNIVDDEEGPVPDQGIWSRIHCDDDCKAYDPDDLIICTGGVAELSPYSRKVKDGIAPLAVAQYNKDKNANLEFVRAVKVYSRSVFYYITLQAKDESGEVKTYYAKFHMDLEGMYTLDYFRLAPPAASQPQTCDQHFTCEICGTKQLKKHIERHLLKHESSISLGRECHDEESALNDVKAQKQYICQKIGCREVFKDASEFQEHEDFHVKLDMGAVFCPVCMKYFFTDRIFEAHLQTCQPITCEICGTMLLKKTKRSRYICENALESCVHEDCHGKLYFCSICQGHILTNVLGFKTHVQNCLRDTTGEIFATKSRIMLKRRHNIKKRTVFFERVFHDKKSPPSFVKASKQLEYETRLLKYVDYEGIIYCCPFCGGCFFMRVQSYRDHIKHCRDISGEMHGTKQRKKNFKLQGRINEARGSLEEHHKAAPPLA